MGDDITIGVTEIVNNIEVTAQPNDQIVDINVTDNADNVTLNITPTVIEINVNKGSSYARWGSILGTLTDQTDLANALILKADLIDGLVPSYQLPSYVDDVIEVANYAALPASGETGKIYITLDTNHIYRWSGSTYIEITDNTAVWGAITGTLSSQTDLVNALNLRVPYTGATSNVNLGEYGLTGGFLALDTTPTSTPTGIGTIYWDSANRTAALIDGDGDTTLQIGQEQRILVHNNTGSTLTDGQVVYVTGSTGNLPSVSLANASSETTSAATLGVVTESIAHGADGFITTSGIVNGLNTLAFNEGDLLWLGTTAGTFTATKPISPNHLVLIGYVIKKAGGNGSILVKIQNTQELDESSDVLFTSLTNNDILTYESSTDLWKNKSIATILGYTPANDSNVVHKTGDETISGRKTFNSTTDIGIRSNISGSGYGVYSENSSNGISFFVANNGSGKGFSVSNAIGSFGNMFDGYYDGTLKYAVNYLGEITGAKFVKSGGTSSQFLKADGSVDSTSYLPLSGGTMTGNLFLRDNNTVGGTNYYIGQTMASNDSWKIYGNTIALDQGELVFELGDNAISSSGGGQRFRFFYNETGGTGGGVSKSPFILDYNDATFDTNATFSGKVGIGTTSPSALLHLNSLSDLWLRIQRGSSWQHIGVDASSCFYNTNSSHRFYVQDGTINPMTITSGGTVNIPAKSSALPTPSNGINIYTGLNIGVINCTNTSGNPTDLYIGALRTSFDNLGTGLVYSNGGFLTSTNPSDRRLKDDITDLPYGLTEILQLRPVTYLWKNDTINQGKQFGFIAQEVQEVMPELVKEFETKDGEEDVVRLGLDKEAIFVAMVNAIKELKAEIELLKAK